MKFGLTLTDLVSRPWALVPEVLTALVHEAAHAGGRLDVERIEITARAVAEPLRLTSRSPKQVAVVPIHGLILQRQHIPGAVTSADYTRMRVRQLAEDAAIDAIVLDVDSPGGEVGGVAELADEVFVARQRKPIIAVANSQACSAGYWIASSATKIVASPSAQLGSIGVFMAHEESSKLLDSVGIKVTLIAAGKYKVEANPWQPLGDAARTYLQGRVDEMHTMFVRDVARGRGLAAPAVRSGFGEGRAVSAVQALALRMADQIATLDQAIAGAAFEGSAVRRSNAQASIARARWMRQTRTRGPMSIADLQAMRYRRERGDFGGGAA